MDKNAIMAQARKIQSALAAVQARAAEMEFSHTSGGGAVEATVNGERELVSLSISPAAMDPEDPEMLEDLVIAAVNGALHDAESAVSEKLSEAAGGIDIGGLLG